MNITNSNAKKVAAALTATVFLFAVAWGARPVLAAPSAPIITTPTQSTSTNPITLTGTADATTTILVTGGASTTASTTASVSGDWSVSVLLTPDSVNNLSVVSMDGSASTSATSTVAITHFTATSTSTSTPTSTSSPIITINGDNPTNVFACNSYTDAGATAISATGTSLVVASTTNLNLEQAGTYQIVYTTTDSDGNTASSTRSVIVLDCNTGSGGSSSGTGDSGSSRTPNDSNSNGSASVGANGTVIAGIVTGAPSIVGIPATGGEVLGVAGFQFAFTLRFGMMGPEVAELQRRLSETGYFRGPITGYFGPLTQDALMRLQRANGLTATGELDVATMFLLNS